MKKRCTKCGEVKDVGEFSKGTRTRDGLKGYCKQCHAIYYAWWYSNNRTARKAYSREYSKKNKTRIREREKSCLDKYRTRKRKSNNHFAKEGRKELSDRYMKRLLVQRTRLSYSDIPPELVELKREQMKLGRLIKAKEKENYENNNRIKAKIGIGVQSA